MVPVHLCFPSTRYYIYIYGSYIYIYILWINSSFRAFPPAFIYPHIFWHQRFIWQPSYNLVEATKALDSNLAVLKPRVTRRCEQRWRWWVFSIIQKKRDIETCIVFCICIVHIVYLGNTCSNLIKKHNIMYCIVYTYCICIQTYVYI